MHLPLLSQNSQVPSSHSPCPSRNLPSPRSQPLTAKHVSSYFQEPKSAALCGTKTPRHVAVHVFNIFPGNVVQIGVCGLCGVIVHCELPATRCVWETEGAGRGMYGLDFLSDGLNRALVTKARLPLRATNNQKLEVKTLVPKPSTQLE